MLPLRHRLKNEKDFALLAKSRKSAYSKVVGVKVRENGLPHSRFGVVVGLKISKRAVKRNLIKRRIREALRKHLKELKPGYDVMVMALVSALKADFSGIETDLLSALGKVGLIEKKNP